jgi:putative FmdB family regulatory protein
MPLYEYTCKKCGHGFEYLARNSEDQPVKCPECGARNPVRQLSTFSAPADGGSSDMASCSTGSCPTGTCPFS